MGTRARIDIMDGSDCLVSIHRQLDGDRLGVEIAKVFGLCRIINGYQLEDQTLEVANGMGCLAAQVVVCIKNSVGNVYLENRKGDPDFVYVLSELDGVLQLAVSTDENIGTLYKGPLRDYSGS